MAELKKLEEHDEHDEDLCNQSTLNFFLDRDSRPTWKLTTHYQEMRTEDLKKRGESPCLSMPLTTVDIHDVHSLGIPPLELSLSNGEFPQSRGLRAAEDRDHSQRHMSPLRTQSLYSSDPES